MAQYKKFDKKLAGDEEGFQSATPQVVAEYRAKRLKCGAVLDCCCGLGSDTIALAKECETVVSVEIDTERINSAKKNAEQAGRKNIVFINSDIFGLDIKGLKNKYSLECAFADPQRRKADGTRVTNLSETQPNTIVLINCLKQDIPNLCIEAPVSAEIPFDCEKEFIGWEGRKGKRETSLTLYFGDLKKCEVSAVALPSGERIEKGTAPSSYDYTSPRPRKYLYELRNCVVRAGLQDELAKKLGCAIYKDFLTFNFPLLTSNFFENRFEVLADCKAGELVPALKKLGAGKIVLRGRLAPDEQIRMKKTLESQLSGEKKLHAFIEPARCLVCRSLDF